MCRLSGAAGRRHRQHRVDRVGIARVAQTTRDFRIPQQAGDPRQRFQMVRACRFRREQQKYQIYGLSIQRFEIDGTIETREQPEQAAELRQFPMWNRDAVADTRRSQLLALQQNFQDRAFILTGERRRAGRQFLNRLFLCC